MPKGIYDHSKAKPRPIKKKRKYTKRTNPIGTTEPEDKTKHNLTFDRAYFDVDKNPKAIPLVDHEKQLNDILQQNIRLDQDRHDAVFQRDKVTKHSYRQNLMLMTIANILTLAGYAVLPNHEEGD